MDKKDQTQNQHKVNLNPEKTPILYTDNIFMTSHEFGIVIDFGQKLGPTTDTQIVSRIGMSRDHAKKFLSELGKMIAMTEGQGATD
ncbi:MAG: DUF3467 domain-containing protein [Patescibacteria group bacterium]|nr:DUF3467 domain-containing protein [Patescibacteria group bacterium]